MKTCCLFVLLAVQDGVYDCTWSESIDTHLAFALGNGSVNVSQPQALERSARESGSDAAAIAPCCQLCSCLRSLLVLIFAPFRTVPFCCIRLQLWDLKTNKLLREWKEHTAEVCLTMREFECARRS